MGLEFHEDPFVSYVTRRGTEMLMAPGMIFTIEPMVNMGGDRSLWTMETAGPFIRRMGSRRPSGEIMVLVTEDGHEVLAW